MAVTREQARNDAALKLSELAGSVVTVGDVNVLVKQVQVTEADDVTLSVEPI